MSIEQLNSESDPPEGTAVVPISDICEAYLMLKGFIDIKKELERLQTKKSKLEGPLNKLKTSLQMIDYDKVPEEVRNANTEKLKQMERELDKVNEAIQSLSIIN